ncbi:MAG TPA: Crp/Fnr family transcriptional regulator [Gammaproteobacteria bacterium]|nr:Crp/Fnr family transcriptional regulator [Gammaproteobacteria bacterium]
MEKLWYTQQTDFLSQLNPKDREELLAIGDQFSCRKNDLIFQAGSPGDSVYFLSDGRAKIFQLSPTGKEVILWFCFAGEMFGMAEIYRRERREVYARACCDTRVVRVNQQDFKNYLTTHVDVAMLTIDLLSCRLRALGDLLLDIASDDVMSRLIKLLTRLSTRYGIADGDAIRLEIPLTHQEMADMIGASRQTVSSAISELRKQGFLSIEHQHILIHKSEELFGRCLRQPMTAPSTLM